MKLELLSTNLVKIIDKCVNSQPLGQLLLYNGSNPLSQLPVSPSDIAPYGKDERVIPYPFDIKYKADERSQLHIYYPEVAFKNNSNVEQTMVWFDVIVHKRQWLYMQDGEKKVRPYDIATQIIKLFDGTIPDKGSTVGQLNFLAMSHVAVNDEFDGVRIEARMTTY